MEENYNNNKIEPTERRNEFSRLDKIIMGSTFAIGLSVFIPDSIFPDSMFKVGLAGAGMVAAWGTIMYLKLRTPQDYNLTNDREESRPEPLNRDSY